MTDKPSRKGRQASKKPPHGLRLEYVDPASLDTNPANWRRHPRKQTGALLDAMREVGWAGALLYNERTKRLIDGHARKQLFEHRGPVPVLVGSWTEEQERKILATLDPLGAMAEADKDALGALVKEMQTGGEGLAGLLHDLKDKAGLLAKDEAKDDRAATPAPSQFNILIECQSEQEQADLLEKLQAQGLQCRSLIS